MTSEFYDPEITTVRMKVGPPWYIKVLRWIQKKLGLYKPWTFEHDEVMDIHIDESATQLLIEEAERTRNDK